MSYTMMMAIGFGVLLPALILLTLEMGRRIGRRWLARNPVAENRGLSAIEAAIFALLGLLIAFTFSGAAVRFDHRRELIAQEVNVIGTSYLRIDLLPPDTQPVLRQKYRRYLDARIATFRVRPDIAKAQRWIAESGALQQEIWKRSVEATQNVTVNSAVTMLVLSGVNEMLDITDTRAMALESHPPAVIYVMLVLMVLASSLFAGFAMASSDRRSWLHMLGFISLISLAMYVTLDVEFPRAGAIRVDAADSAMIDLRKKME